MKLSIPKFVVTISFCTISICILGIQSIQAQKDQYLSFNDILAKLTFTSRISTTIEEINKQLIADIKNRKVNFILKDENEKELRKAGANDLLIVTVRNNLPKQIRKKIEKNQYNPKNLSLDYILSTLKMSSITDKSLDEINEFLVNDVCKNGTIFELDSNTEKTLKDTGASDELIQGIIYFQRIEDLYIEYVNNYQGNDIEQKKRALSAAKEFVKIAENNVCKKIDDLSRYVDYFNPQIAYLEKWIRERENPPSPTPPIYPKRKILTKFDKAYKANDWKVLFETGDEIIKNDSPSIKLDAAIFLASVGYHKLVKPNKDDKYFDEKTIHYAELAISFIAKDIDSTKYGVYNYQYKTDKHPDGKSNALGWMNYIIGYIKYYRLNQKDEAISYFQKAIQYESEVKKFTEINQIINVWKKENLKDQNSENL